MQIFCFVSYLCLLITKLAHSKSVLEEPKNIKEQKKKFTYIQLLKDICYFVTSSFKQFLPSGISSEIQINTSILSLYR